METIQNAQTTTLMGRSAKQATNEAGEGTAYEVRPSNFIVVTPLIASEWLSHCDDEKKNRPKSKMAVEKYVRIMKRGEWRPNPSQPISFTKEGVLVNGQHRLNAVIEAGMPVKMAVVWDADIKDFDVIDTGRKRTLGDIFAMEDIKNYVHVSSIVTKCMALASGRTLQLIDGHGGGGMYRVYDLAKDYLEEYKDDPDFYQEVACFSQNLIKNRVRMLHISDIGGFIAFLHRKKGHKKEEAMAFFDALYNGGGTYRYLQDLATILNNDINSDKKMRGTHKQSLIAKAWNMFLANSHASRVRVPLGTIVEFN